MRNIRINEAESIFEVMWNGGEPGTQKYPCLHEWNIEGKEHCRKISSGWSAASLRLSPSKSDFPVRMERSCQLDITEYDRFLFRGTLSKMVKFRIVCCIDGEEREVLYSLGIGNMKEYSGAISGSCITKIRLEFENMDSSEGVAEMVWLGLAHSGRLKTMLTRKSPYTPDWPGCFAEKAEFKPQLSLFFGEEDLEKIRGQVSHGAFKDALDKMRESAKKTMRELVPEDLICDYVRWSLFRREREMEMPSLIRENAMQNMAFVGLIDQNEEMMRFACRMALSVCHCRYFQDGLMSSFPGVSWHRRSFSENEICNAVVKTLDWAGGVLTWHAKDLMFDALMMKGLPRLDGDIKTVDDIWFTNQGLVFIGGLILTLLALSKQYPRYSSRVEEEERDFLKMWENYVQTDGGALEGGSYWNFTIGSVIDTLLLLSRYHGKSLEEYTPESIRRSGKYMEALLSEVTRPNGYIPYNDAHLGLDVSVLGIHLLAAIGGGKLWEYKSNQLNEEGAVGGSLIQNLLLLRQYDVAEEPERETLINLPVSGVTTLRRKDEKLGNTALFAFSGRSFPGHTHQDKGSFLLEAGGKCLLADRGTCSYQRPEHLAMIRSEMHNMITPFQNGEHKNQMVELFDITKPKQGDHYSGIVRQAAFENGQFVYETDVTACWGGIFAENVRTIQSGDPAHYQIKDVLRLDPSYEISFNLTAYGEITKVPGDNGEDFLIQDGEMRVRVHPVNWTPVRCEYGPCAADGEDTSVNRLCMFTGGKARYELITQITVEKT